MPGASKLLRVGAPPVSTVPAPELWLPAGGTFWQDSARTTPATVNGNPVGAWDDVSGFGRHALQPTAGNRPALTIPGLNGLAVTTADGINDAIGGALPASATRTLFVVLKPALPPGGDRTHLSNGGSALLKTNAANSATNWFYSRNQAAGAVVTTQAVSTVAWVIYCVNYASTSSAVIRFNGGASTATFDPDDSYSTATAYVLNASTLAGAGPASQAVAEVYSVGSSLSLAGMDAVGNLIAGRLALAWTPTV